MIDILLTRHYLIMGGALSLNVISLSMSLIIIGKELNIMTEFQSIISSNDNIVFFGGAGVSTESGIPDFRSVDGLYNEKYKYPPETIISHSFFMRQTEEFYDFYLNKMIFLNAKPNMAHIKLAQMESAGSKNVLELHGSVHRNYCMKCGKFYNVDYIINYIENNGGIPECTCSGIIKPDVVLYEEGLDGEIIEKAISYIRNADVLIIGGTSLVVYPAAGLINYFNGNKLVLINKSFTSMDSRADLVINDSIGKVFKNIKL